MQSCAFADCCVQIDGLPVDRDLTGFDFRKVENVVEQHHHRPSGLYDQFDIFPLWLVQFGLQHQLGKTQNAVHRSADFVTHIGEEF